MSDTDQPTAPEQPPAPEPASTRPAAAKPAAAKPPARKRPSPPSPLAVIAGSLGLFFVVLTLLAIQVRSGRDPSLGPGIVAPVTSTSGTTAGGTTGAGATQTQQATTIVTKTSPVPPP